ncbi:hypothetical protein [Tropicimonas sp. IMCC6043]|uniref:hypothetical protein n=1 Tax=Tropicimonas sp. IMCC6043 TaxID=2510645 RepID=UPI00101D469D|nr:hypothetical protein [Tropicimonas sp. IMCC6043]RYH08827.1 hypothetical protein EU800_15210 [Tropicimonas sp. IMCC6043]
MKAEAKKNAGAATPATGVEFGARNISDVNLSTCLDCDPDVTSLTTNPGAMGAAAGVRGDVSGSLKSGYNSTDFSVLVSKWKQSPDNKTTNAGAAATATGARYTEEETALRAKNRTSWRAKALRHYAKPSHKAAARMVGYALTLRNDYGNAAAAIVFRHRLDPEDRAIIATAVLDSLTDREFAGVMRHFCGEGAA